jgi:hypothetical protein
MDPGNRSGIGTAGMISSMKSRHDGSIAAIERLLEPVSRSLNVEAAKKLIKLKADAKTQIFLETPAPPFPNLRR